MTEIRSRQSPWSWRLLPDDDDAAWGDEEGGGPDEDAPESEVGFEDAADVVASTRRGLLRARRRAFACCSTPLLGSGPFSFLGLRAKPALFWNFAASEGLLVK